MTSMATGYAAIACGQQMKNARRMTMKVRIIDDPEKAYLCDNYHGRFANRKTLDFLRGIAGQTLDVDVTRLSSTSFVVVLQDDRTEKIEGKYVAEVIDDVREQHKRCCDCGRSSSRTTKVCPFCSEVEFQDILSRQGSGSI
jgi:hypothetical protein